MIKSLHIKNFKLFKDLEVDNLGQFNLVLGENNTGKTSFLEAIKVLEGHLNPVNLGHILVFRKGLLDDSDSKMREFFYMGDPLSEIELYAEQEDYTLKLSIASTFLKRLRNEQKAFPKGAQDGRYLIFYEGLEFETSVLHNGVELQKFVSTVRFNVDPSKHEIKFADNAEVQAEYIKQTAFVHTTASLDLHVDAYNSVVKGGGKQGLLSFLQKLEPNIIDSNLLTSTELLFNFKNGQSFYLHSMGDGFRKMFNLFVWMNATKGGVLLIDELENGLHHKAQEMVWRHLLKTAKELNIQLFITTHSYELMQSLARVLSSDDFQEYVPKVRAIRLERLAEDADITAKVVGGEMLVDVIRDGYEIR